jgi:hypothetical protein
MAKAKHIRKGAGIFQDILSHTDQLASQVEDVSFPRPKSAGANKFRTGLNLPRAGTRHTAPRPRRSTASGRRGLGQWLGSVLADLPRVSGLMVSLTNRW